MALKVATGVCLVPQRDPIHTAKQVATVDVLSHGRVIFGVGAGWNRQEMRNHGTDPKTRMRMLTERVQAMIEIWTKDEAEYHGQLVDFDPLQAWPKPVQTRIRRSWSAERAGLSRTASSRSVTAGHR
jgi:alkanesulfonate monooxygenase SsuD/methylene tetrahydromethanopterin reductase-like flavin-dependent oxidoreductase (luciferase family)